MAGLAGAVIDFTIYAEGVCMASVCSSLPQDEVERRMAMHSTGIDSSWRFDEAGEFSGGQPNPCPCCDTPETHTHYLFSC